MGFGWELSRYFAVSMVALIIDTGLLLVLAKTIHYLLAACIAFLTGTLVHYIMSVRLVFETRRLQHKRNTEGLLFLAAGLCAMLVNMAIIYIGVEWFFLPLLAAKLFAAGGSFVTGYMVRKTLLFS